MKTIFISIINLVAFCFLGACSHHNLINAKRFPANIVQCHDLVKKIAHSNVPISFEDDLESALEKEMSKDSFPLWVSDYFVTGDRGTNVLRHYRELSKAQLPKNWLSFNLRDEVYQNNYERPQVMSVNAIGAEDSFVIYKNDIYSNSFFMKAKNNKKEDSFLMNEQPWFEWNSVQKSYVLKIGGSNAKLLKALFKDIEGNQVSKIKLYRGTFEGEYHLLNLLKNLEQKNNVGIENDVENLLSSLKSENPFYRKLKNYFKESVGEELNYAHLKKLVLKDYLDILEDNDFGKYLFTTPDRKKAELFSKGAILEFEVDVYQLEKLVSQKSLYVGIEYQLELGFFAEKGIDLLSKNLTTYQLHSEYSKIFSEREHLLWKK